MMIDRISASLAASGNRLRCVHLFLGSVLSVVVLCLPSHADVITEIAFETGNVAPAGGGQTANGWKFDPFNFFGGIGTVDPSRPDFENGQNQEAFKISPFLPPGSVPAPTNSLRSRQGVVWEHGQDLNAGAVETFDQGEVLYTVIEYFNDVARRNTSSARYKTQLFLGELDNGSGANVGVAGVGGFNGGDGTPFDEDSEVFETTMQWSDQTIDAGLASSGVGMSFSGTRISGNTHEIADVSKNHISWSVFRHGSDSAEGFVGTELEIDDTGGRFNGGDALGASEPWGGNTVVVEGAVIDKVTAFMSRTRLEQPAPGEGFTGEGDAAISSWLDVGESDPNEADSLYNAEHGIKYIRVATTSKFDVNLDGSVDSADLAIVSANLDLFGPTTADFDGDNDVDGSDFLIWQRGNGVGTTQAEGDADGNGTVDGLDLAIWESEYGTLRAGTHFDGDVDNDLDVDADDLAAVQAAIPALAASNAVPEPPAAAMLLLGLLGFSLAGRRE